MTVDLIVNPASGPARRLPRARRLHFVSGLLRTRGVEVRGCETAGPGDATRLAAAARDAGTDLVLVWGGDGTVNEVATSLLDTGIPMGLIAGGSGNGLARGLGIPLGVEAAVDVALDGTPRDIDAGLVDGRPFLNLAGIGFDAAVAARVNTRNLHRGLGPYVSGIFREWRTFETRRFEIALDDRAPVEVVAHLVAVCNGQQYGHGARIAPNASFDDGLLDVVAVPRITAGRIALHAWRLFNGTMPRVPGVFSGRARRAVVSQSAPTAAHVDGEVVEPACTRVFTIRPRGVRIMTR